MKLTQIFCVFLLVAGSHAAINNVLALFPEFKQLQDMVNSMNAKINSNIEKINSNSLRQKVGFSSYLTADLGISNGQKIRFDSTLYNYGNFYSTYSGIFTCPYDGVYLFNYFIASRNNVELDVKLLVNGVLQNRAIAESKETYHDTQGGNAAILKLNKNDQVWIGASEYGSIIVGRWRYSTFSGLLVA